MAREVDPKMHTAEHILSQTMIRLYGCGRPSTTHMDRKKSKCDYHIDRAPTEEEIREIEKRVNDIIQADMVVAEEFVNVREAEQEYDLERLPEGAGSRIRIVKIGHYDACPCIGSHVKSTGEIGGFRIASSSFENGILRIRFRLDRLLFPLSVDQPS